MNVRGKKVFVGLSGGVDSSVTAALMKDAGAEVYGVFIQGWYPTELPCTWREDRQDAMRVAAHLNIPFHTLDASKEYKKSVIDYLISEYREGKTPNPDLMCNRDVKFGAFYTWAREHGADFVATGHYARVESGKLYRGVDEDKDQSYFLANIDRDVLPHILFPLGEYKKSEVRELAKKYRVPTAEKRDSQGICFLGNVSIEEFLRAEFPLEQGDIVDTEGNVVGTHNGSQLYTLGERISVASGMHAWYVVAKDLSENTLTVAESSTNTMPAKDISIHNLNLLADVPEGELLAQYRYHGPVIHGSLNKDRTSFVPTGAVGEYLASGQELALYSGELLIGGGIIS